MGPFIGGLHYSEKFTGMNGAGQPGLRTFTAPQKELMDRNSALKRHAVRMTGSLTVVSPSRWLREASEESAVLSGFRHLTIPNGFDTGVFRVRDKTFARDVFGLPKDKKILLFVSDALANHRKGLDFLLRALEGTKDNSLMLCAVGSVDPGLGQSFHYLGRIHDEPLMSLAYAVADALVIPSLEDNLPNTMIESLLCGTPVIGVPVGGIAETIRDGFNGKLSADISVDALRQAIADFVATRGSWDSAAISKDAAWQFDERRQAQAYVGLYREILESTKPR